ncbi:cation:proton antiporter [Sediminitomix flava]|uniref:Sodium/proton antiporter (CPA1 family) n=1 Tax=Sediminitomix flava TaxID=379075 RepID=A0A315YW61_SEDFL|nr:sodium:proton antiporter [Sediminitomix flava]PWJ34145.1 sodium/proton antiporter (CPA1 family) [Sediminitomix flava]
MTELENSKNSDGWTSLYFIGMFEIAGLLVLGFFAQWLAWRIKVPAILPLIIVGLVFGPISSLFTPTGEKLIDGDRIFQGERLFDVVSISVGLILFEGGLTLKFKEVKSLATVVRNMIFYGSVVTLIGGALAVHNIMGFSYQIAFLFGALIIVTGPTVIGPILRNVKPNDKISTILKWEGILIDPVGALIAILIYEFIVSGKPNEYFTLFALKTFATTVVAGVFVGGLFAWFLYKILTNKLLPYYLRNTVVLGIVIMAFALADILHAESGLLAVTILGMILANLKIEGLKEILSFKADVVLILISFLFVMLSSRMDMADLEKLMNWESLLLFLVIVLVLRPLVVFLSAIKSELNLREKIFISFICPRGIVAAGVASIFTVKMVDLAGQAGLSPKIVEDAQMLLPLTFMTIVGTVIIQGLLAKQVANALGVTRKKPNGILFLGAGETARTIAKYLKGKGIPVMLGDTAKSNVNECRTSWLPVYEGSLFSDEGLEEMDFSKFGKLFAMTSNTDINVLGNRIIGKEIGDGNVYRLASKRELEITNLENPKNLLFHGKYDFISLTQAFRRRTKIQEVGVNTQEDLEKILEEKSDSIIPLLIVHEKNAFPVTEDLVEIKEGSTLAFLPRV